MLGKSRRYSKKQQHGHRSKKTGSTSDKRRLLRFETLEDRRLLAAHSAEIDVPYGVYTAEEITQFESRLADSSLSSKTPLNGARNGIPGTDVLTFVLDFKEVGQNNTSDVFGNVVSTFDVTSFGFVANEFDMVANEIFEEVGEDYFDELVETVAGPAGQDLEVDFVIGDIGTAPPGITEFYYIQIGTGFSGPHINFLGVASGSSVRNDSGTGPNNDVEIGDVVGSVFTDTIVALSSLSPSDALTSGNITFTRHAVSGTLSHEIGHALSLSHLNKAASVQPTDNTPPLMGTGALDLLSQDRISEREFSISGVDGENGDAEREHIQQLVDAVGLHDLNPSVIIATAGLHGSISPNGAVAVAGGGDLQFTAFPDSGYVVDEWYYNDASTPEQLGGVGFTASNIQDDGWVLVVFEPAPVAGTLTITSPTIGDYSLDTYLNVGWTSADINGDLQIELLYDGSHERFIDSSVPVAYGSKRWRIPDDLTPDSGYQVRISSLTSSVTATSASFTLVPEGITGETIIIDSYFKLTKIASGGNVGGFIYKDDAHYELAGDIDADGANLPPLLEFDGVFDGKGYYIRDINMGSVNAENVGLFSSIGGEGIVKNLNIQVDEVDGQYRVGTIAGQNRGHIINTHVYIHDKIKGWVGTGDSQDNGFVGGIVGVNDGVISNSSVQKFGGGLGEIIDGGRLGTGGIAGDNDGVIQWSFFNGEMSGNDRNGGIAGENHGTITESYVLGIVDGDLETGGLVGRASSGGTISNSYVGAQVDGRLDSGGLVGINRGTLTKSYFYGSFTRNPGSTRNGALAGENDSTISDSFWDTQTTGLGTSRAAGTDGSSGTVINSHGLTSAELYQQASFTTTYGTNWDFSDIWTIDEGNDYPQLLGAGPSIAAGPATVSASDGLAGKVQVTWLAVPDALAYGVYRSPASNVEPEFLGWSTGLSFDDTTPIVETTYHYFVTAAYTINSAGESDVEQANSDTGVATFQADAPANVSATNNLANQVFVQWDTVAGASHYRAYRSDTEVGAKTPLTGWVTSTSSFDTTTTIGQNYYYWITAAVDALGSGEGEFSSYAIGREGESDIRLSTASHDFGRQNLGENIPTVVTLFNDGAIDLVVSELSGLAAPFEAFPTNGLLSIDDWTISAGGSRDFTVVFNPTSGGVNNDQLSIASNDPDDPLVALSLQGTGNFVPTVVIDSVTPSPALTDTDTITFNSTGADVDAIGPLSYEWYSSIDGLIDSSEDFSVPASNLSLGEHAITLRVIDDEGAPSAWANTSLTVSKYAADYNFDSIVDGHDFLAWQRGFGTTAPDATKGDGDADNDRDVDGDDLATWESQFGPELHSLANSGFEINEPTDNSAFPTTFGDWTGDISEIVTAQNGIVPAEGNQMLHFINTSHVGPAFPGSSSDVWQLVDVSSLATDITAGRVVIELSALFNRIAGDLETDTEFRIEIDALDGVPADFFDQKVAGSELATSVSGIFTDGDLLTWEEAVTSLLLPAGTEYIAIMVNAVENTVNDGVAPELDGHYADDIVLTVNLVEPGVLNSDLKEGDADYAQGVGDNDIHNWESQFGVTTHATAAMITDGESILVADTIAVVSAPVNVNIVSVVLPPPQENLLPMKMPPPLEIMSSPPPLDHNTTPLVYAGEDLSILVSENLALEGEVLVNSPSNLTVSWSLVSGPGTVFFNDPSNANTTVSFSTAGTYELELTAISGGASASDRVIVTVYERPLAKFLDELFSGPIAVGVGNHNFPESGVFSFIAKPFFTNLEDNIFAGGFGQHLNVNSTLELLTSPKDGFFERLSNSTRWKQGLTRQDPSAFSSASAHSQTNEFSKGRFNRHLAEDTVYEDLIDELFADEKFNPVLCDNLIAHTLTRH